MKYTVYEASIDDIGVFRNAFRSKSGKVGMVNLELFDAQWDIYFVVPDLMYTNVIQFVVYFSDSIELQKDTRYTISLPHSVQTTIRVVHIYTNVLLRNDGLQSVFQAYVDDEKKRAFPRQGTCLIRLSQNESLLADFALIEDSLIEFKLLLKNVDFTNKIEVGKTYKSEIFHKKTKQVFSLRITNTHDVERDEPVKNAALAVF